MQAFDTGAEADLVEQLRQRARPLVSLVAEGPGVLPGHILFSPVTLEGQAGLQLMGLAPLAVRPDHQGQGIGSALVEHGLAACRAAGIGAVVVLGHATYYPRFGFVPASRFGLRSEYAVPDEVFMACELLPGYLESASGLIRYHPAFAEL